LAPVLAAVNVVGDGRQKKKLVVLRMEGKGEDIISFGQAWPIGAGLPALAAIFLLFYWPVRQS
jgi:hypothetical protein